MRMRVGKIAKYSGNVARVFFRNTNQYGMQYACWYFFGEVAQRLRMEKLAVRMLSKKSKYILHYLDNIARQTKPEYLYHEDQNPKNRIWMFWWTGLESAPDIVKMSVNSVKVNADGWEVYFLDQNNYQEYVTLPEYIIEKHNSGIITHAMFSDLLRITLLALYGGVWIDATVLLLRALPDELKTVKFYTCKTYDKNSLHVSKSRWTSYFLAGSPEFELYKRARELLCAYWRINDVQIDYLLIDYVLEYIRLTEPDVRRIMSDLPDNNFRRNELFCRLNEPYTEELLKEYSEDETFVYKCSWRYGTFTENDKDGNQTLYGFLKEKYLE